jgi:hypothetical protein
MLKTFNTCIDLCHIELKSFIRTGKLKSIIQASAGASLAHSNSIQI